MEVLPVDVISGVIASEITRNWEVAIKEIESTGHVPPDIKPTSVRAIGEFVNSVSYFAVSSNQRPHPKRTKFQRARTNVCKTLSRPCHRTNINPKEQSGVGLLF